MRSASRSWGPPGYAGGELIRLLAAHPGARCHVPGRARTRRGPLAEVHPHLGSLAGRARRSSSRSSVGAIAERADVVFCCAAERYERWRSCRACSRRGVRVIDLAGDFRLAGRGLPGLVRVRPPGDGRGSSKAVYGLPELFGDRIAGAQLVANPGLLPDGDDPGAGAVASRRPGRARPRSASTARPGCRARARPRAPRRPSTATEESVRPYRVPSHQHTPEMERGLELATGLDPTVLFVPHLVPTVRGVVTTSYADARRRRPPPRRSTEALEAAYADRPFVRVLPARRRDGRFEAHAWHQRRRTAGRRRPADRHGRRVRCRRQPRQGRRRSGDPEHEPGLRSRRGDRRSPPLAVYP